MSLALISQEIDLAIQETLIEPGRRPTSFQGWAIGPPRELRTLPTLTDLLQVAGSAGLVTGACLGFFLHAEGAKDLAQNVVLAGGVGAIVGAMVGFALAAGLAVGGGA